MPQVKSAGKAQAKPSTKITIALPDAMLEWAEQLASVRHLERNDVLRMALANGLLLMQAEGIRLTEEEKRGGEEYSAQVGGIEGFEQKIRASMQADAKKVELTT
jgi:hypothetical protein